MPNQMVVRAFDGTRREVEGDIEIPITIRPCVFNVLSQVMDMAPAYTCLLGRSWIHSAEVVPSLLHQKVKFTMDNEQVIVSREDELLISKPTNTPYVEVAEESLECSFRSFGVVNVAYVAEGSLILVPRLSNASRMVAMIMVDRGYEPRKGLQAEQQEIFHPISLPKHDDRFGLGYSPTRVD
ncbi:hypothetical protein CFOL_v3_21537 [Cephalotus follicularis]|uniref:Uncharacterized protein n=1 Tax=Cephalotus follicularis TaxID=3775 RepID=A0A1Q3CCV4_CEPFO|nr:hypothetical protein CFOL_v3_21537 [Cephalotus follicularis]